MHLDTPIARLLAGFLTFLAAMLAAVANAGAMCQPVAVLPGGLMHRAAYTYAALPAGGGLTLTFLGHASFLIETPGNVTAVTDYNGYIRPERTPDIVTMNHGHSTHYTDSIDPGIKHVLRGWDPDGGMAVHDVTVGDLRVRNVPTNLRAYGGTERNGNSIFVFETAGLCVAHLGHLHHTLTDQHLAELGVIDVLLVPVDGSYTMAQDYMVEVIGQIDPALVIPMHYFNPVTLAGFIQRMNQHSGTRGVGAGYEVKTADSASVTLSRQNLPYHQILVLPGS
jgi:L-ascorbate metabolism protein UlaG (beta-lactamase superfamily)